MPPNLIQIKPFLGKYYQELLHSASQDKYVKTNLNTFFEQRFIIQSNKTQMIIDSSLPGLTVIISGNEIHISKELYDHEYIDVSNSMETKLEDSNPKSLYTPDIFSRVAYLVCQNHIMFNIVGNIEEPIYIKYKSDYETFYSSVAIVNIAEGIDVEIVEEIESRCALNTVTNYILNQNARLNLSTFYNNKLSAISFSFRDIIAQDNSKFSHIMFGRSSTSVIDEFKIQAQSNSSIELLACIYSSKGEFHSIVGIQPGATDYEFNLNQRHLLSGTGKTTFIPSVFGHLPQRSYTNVRSLMLDEFVEPFRSEKEQEFIVDMVDRAVLERTVGVDTFYKNKSKFLKSV